MTERTAHHPARMVRASLEPGAIGRDRPAGGAGSRGASDWRDVGVTVPHGRDALKQFVQRFRSAFPDIHIQVEHALVDGDMVVVRCSVTANATGPGIEIAATGKPIAMTGMCMVRVEGRHDQRRLEQFRFSGAVPAARPDAETGVGRMHWTDRRERYRAVLAGDACVHPGSVFDPISARIAEDLGFEVGMFAGSIASSYGAGRARSDRADAVGVRGAGVADQSRGRIAADGRCGPRLRQCAERHAHGAGTGNRRGRRADHRGYAVAAWVWGGEAGADFAWRRGWGRCAPRLPGGRIRRCA